MAINIQSKSYDSLVAKLHRFGYTLGNDYEVVECRQEIKYVPS